MSTQDILNIVLIIFLLIVTGVVVAIAVFLIKALKSIASLAQSLEDTTQSIKDRVQMRFLTALPSVLIALASRIFKRGR